MTNLLHNTVVKFAMPAFMAMVLFLSYCSATKKHSNQPLRTITIVTNYDLVMIDNGELIHIEDSFRVSYYQDLILYQVPYLYEVTKPIFKNDTIEEKIISSEIRYRYFIYKTNNPLGYKYDSLNALSNRLFSVDSFLTAKAFAKFNFYNKENDSLIETTTDRKTKILTEKYIPRIKYDETYADSSYRYFSDHQLKNIEFSFSRYLDSTKNKKLFKVIFIHNPIPKGTYSFYVPRRNLIFEMKETLLINSAEIIAFFKRVRLLYK